MWRWSHIQVSNHWASVTWGKMRVMTQLENKGLVIVIPPLSPPSPSSHWDFREGRASLSQLSEIFPTADSRVSFSRGSEAQGQKLDLQSFSVKCTRLHGDKSWRIAPPLRKSSVGLYRVCGGKKQQQSPQCREFLHFSSFWSHGDGVYGESGFKWFWQITAEGCRGGLVS